MYGEALTFFPTNVTVNPVRAFDVVMAYYRSTRTWVQPMVPRRCRLAITVGVASIV